MRLASRAETIGLIWAEAWLELFVLYMGFRSATFAFLSREQIDGNSSRLGAI